VGRENLKLEIKAQNKARKWGTKNREKRSVHEKKFARSEFKGQRSSGWSKDKKKNIKRIGTSSIVLRNKHKHENVLAKKGGGHQNKDIQGLNILQKQLGKVQAKGCI